MDFDRMVVKACKNISASDNLGDHDFRPRVKDLNSGIEFLIDTGAATSVFPKHLTKHAKMDQTGGLQAINGAKIPSFGRKTMKIRFDRKTFLDILQFSII